MREDYIKGCIQRKYVLSLEVTNGLDRNQFAYKVGEALSGKKHLRKLADNPDTEVESGLIFTRNEEAINSRRYALDFLYQIKEFKQSRAQHALAQASQQKELIYTLQLRPGNDRPRFNDISSAMYELVRTGTPLENIFYPDERQLAVFRKQFPQLHLPERVHGYNHAISDVKGVVLEEYVKLFCKDVMPSDTEIFARHNYKWKGHRRDIDIILAGDKDRIIEGLRNAKDLREFNTEQKRQKDKFFRPSFNPAFH